MAGGALPNLLMIGAAKSGTSSLHYYLGLHPEVQMSQPKELHFFIDEEGFNPAPYVSDPSEARLFGEWRTWRLGTDWYAQHFAPEAPVRGESSVAYSFPWYEGTAERMAAVVPEARIIYLVRDPVERIVSHYRQYRGGGREWRSLEEALRDPNNVYSAATRYGTVLDRYLDHFSRERMLVIRQDELRDDRRGVLERVYRFLEVDPGFVSPEFEMERNRTDVKGRAYHLAERLRLSPAAGPLRRMPAPIKARIERRLARPRADRSERPVVRAEIRRRLVDYLEPEIARLEQVTGWNLDRWRDDARAAA